MTPDRTRLILDTLLKSLDLWIDQAEALAATHGDGARHLLATMQQGRTSLRQLIERSRGCDKEV